MSDGPCHAERLTPREAAKQLVLKDLGVKRVAFWCDVTEGAVHQWLTRATDETPIPPRRVAQIIAGAHRDRVALNLKVLAPWLPVAEAA